MYSITCFSVQLLCCTVLTVHCSMFINSHLVVRFLCRCSSVFGSLAWFCFVLLNFLESKHIGHKAQSNVTWWWTRNHKYGSHTRNRFSFRSIGTENNIDSFSIWSQYSFVFCLLSFHWTVIRLVKATKCHKTLLLSWLFHLINFRLWDY